MIFLFHVQEANSLIPGTHARYLEGSYDCPEFSGKFAKLMP
jgi:hypothetical protein